MHYFEDCFGARIRLTDERRDHILEHPEMKEMLDKIGATLHAPELVRTSRTDAESWLFYRYYARTMVGGKWLCIVVKYGRMDAFVVTAYLTDRPKAGEDLWPAK